MRIATVLFLLATPENRGVQVPGVVELVHGQRFRDLPDGRDRADSGLGESLAGADGLDADLHFRTVVGVPDVAGEDVRGSCQLRVAVAGKKTGICSQPATGNWQLAREIIGP